MEHEKARGLLQRAEQLVEIEQGMSKRSRRNAEYLPSIVHALVPANTDGIWKGKTEDITRDQSVYIDQIKQSMERQEGEISMLKNAIETLTNKLG